MNRAMKSGPKTPDRLLNIGGAVILLCATVLEFFFLKDAFYFVQIPPVVILALNVVCLVAAVFVCFFPQFYLITYMVMLLQCFATVSADYATISGILFAFMVFMMFLNGFFRTHHVIRILMMIFVWILLFSSLLFNNPKEFVLMIGETVFFSLCFIGFYLKTQKELFHLSPVSNIISRAESQLPQLPRHGDSLSLDDFGFSERQKNFILDICESGLSYKEIADKYHTSISLVKKEMSVIFEAFHVRSRNDLKLLLSFYRIIS